MKKSVVFFRRTAKWVIGVFTAGLMFTACKKSDNRDEQPVAGLMGFNLVPEGRTIAFLTPGNPGTTNQLAFNNFTGGYMTVAAGQGTVGAINSSGGGILASAGFNFEAKKYYSVFLVGTDPGYETLIVNDNLDSLSTSTQAFVRYVQAIPGASNPVVTIAVNGNEVINETASFKTVSNFTAVDEGPVTITVSNGGTIDVTRTITLEKQKVYTILLIGKPGNTGDTAVQIRYIQNGTVDATAGRMRSPVSAALK